MDAPGWFYKIEPVIEFIIDSEILHAGHDWMGAIQNLDIRFQDLVFALLSAPGAAQQIELPLDILGALGPDRPVQCDDAALALSEPFEGSVALRIKLHPLRALREIKRHPIRLVYEFRTFRPR